MKETVNFPVAAPRPLHLRSQRPIAPTSRALTVYAEPLRYAGSRSGRRKDAASSSRAARAYEQTLASQNGPQALDLYV
jgi:hypothetical protein